MDIIYYASMLKYLADLKIDMVLSERIKWIESIGLRRYEIHEYSKEELDFILKKVIEIVSKYVYVTDGDTEKFGVLYKWMIENITFVNEDDPKDNSLLNLGNVYEVFNYGRGGRLSYAKAFQLLLSFAGVDALIVYSLGAMDTIGYYDGQKVYSLLGSSDYALVRVSLDGKYYYSDIAWDSFVNNFNFFDKLRLFLVSKEELLLRHKLVGEGNVLKSYSYHGDDSDDLVMFSENRIVEANELFNDIERLGTTIFGIELNINFKRNELSTYKEKLDIMDNDSLDYNKLTISIKKIEEEIENFESELIRLDNQRNGIIRSYSNILNNRYVGKYDDKNIMLEVLSNRKNMGVLSDYLYDILLESLKVV